MKEQTDRDVGMNDSYMCLEVLFLGRIRVQEHLQGDKEGTNNPVP